MQFFSHSTSSTARLFLLKSLFHPAKKILILTDHDEERMLLQYFAERIYQSPIEPITSIGDICTVSPIGGSQRIMPLHLLKVSGSLDYLRRKTSLELKRGMSESIEQTIEQLIEYGYSYTPVRSEPYTYTREGSLLSIRGGKVDEEYMIEWFDTEIDSIICSDIRHDIRSHTNTVQIQRKGGDASLGFTEIAGVNRDILALLREQYDTIILIGGDFFEGKEILFESIDIHFPDFHREGAESLGVETIQIEDTQDLKSFLGEHTNIRIYTKLQKTVEEFLELQSISGIQIEDSGGKKLESVTIPESSLNPLGFHVLADDIFGKLFIKKRSKKSVAKSLELLLDLTPGDLVVHRDHGIGRFFAILKKELSGIEREYIELHYALGDKLFVPITEIYRVSKYLGKQDVELTRLSGKEWEKTITATSEEIEQIAQDILETNAKRSLAKGRAFGAFPEQEALFQQAFPYTYTRDQRGAIDEIFEDMESENPMDRLVSGDVGFGKTEVAMNAIYKAVLSGTQVAVISPLLVLADEHYETFLERFSPFGIRVGVMTRMNTPREVEQTLQGLAEGTIDVVVGTHRLLSDDIRFKRLGLLIIDEEHKFGVSHKEKIKKLRAGVDILALSATPIPRSLNLALSGVKKISLLTTPPASRKPIETIVSRWNEEIIYRAIEREFSRGGQVIVLYNRVATMPQIEQEIQDLIQDLTPQIIMTHGQMPGEQIEDRIHAFKKREYNILLTTTIIENGVNFLSANTIIIIDPEEFGLASLHQLRGRVGRKDQDGFCYLLYRKTELVGEEKERLITIANNSHLGAGFEIAMRDLEIRGAGEVLGIKQSGKSKDVGLALYFRMLEEKVQELRSYKRQHIDTKIELDLSYVLDQSVFLSENDKLNFFREIENIDDLIELDEIEHDMTKKLDGDSTGFLNFFLLMRARLILREYMVTKVSMIGINYVFDFHESVTPLKVRAFLDRFDQKKRMTLLSLTKIRVEKKAWKSSQAFLRAISGS